MDLIPLVIIATPSQDRSAPLLNTLKNSTIFDVIKLEATLGENLKIPTPQILVDELVKYGRSLTQNERACSLSHTAARTIIQKSTRGGVVLEDDARITSLSQFESSVLDFLEKKMSFKKILSLVQYDDKVSQEELCNANNLIRLPGACPLAVAYALTPVAAENLNLNSSKSSGVSDWPDSGCTYYILRNGLVRHGDEKSISIIGTVETRSNQLFASVRGILTYQDWKLIPISLARVITRKIVNKLTQIVIQVGQR